MASQTAKILARDCRFIAHPPPGFLPELTAEIEEILASPLLRLARDHAEVREKDGAVEITTPYRRGLELLSRLGPARTFALRLPTPRHPVRSLPELEACLSGIPWSDLLGNGAVLRPGFDSRSSTLWHEGKVRTEVEQWFKSQGFTLGDGPQKTPEISIVHDLVEIHIPMATTPLWFRSYRQTGGVAAPFREDLAQACLRAAGGPAEDEFVFVPFAGSGTFYFEYALSRAAIPAAVWGRTPAIQNSLETWSWLGSQKTVRDYPAGLGVEWNEAAHASLVASCDRFGAPAFQTLRDDAFSRPWTDWIPDDQPRVFVPLNPPHGGRLGKGSDIPGLYARIAGELCAIAKNRMVRGFAVCPDERTWRKFGKSLGGGLHHTTRHFGLGGRDTRLVVFHST